MLGDISGKFESGNLGFDAIAHNPKDPGGASYGKWQLAANTGTLQKFLAFSSLGNKFNGLTPGSAQFDAMWRDCCKTLQFCTDQFNFIKATHFDPVQNYWLNNLKMETCDAIDEALWSMAVQHSYNGCVKILNLAMYHIPESYTDADCVNKLYEARETYVRGLNLNTSILNSIVNRYFNERIDVLKLIK